MPKLHGQAHHNRQRNIALAMIGTGALRVIVWLALIALYLAKVGFAVSLFSSVSFVSLLSVLALALTDWGQVAASLSQLTASHAHEDAESTRAQIGLDTESLSRDIKALGRMAPGTSADLLAENIEKRLGAK